MAKSAAAASGRRAGRLPARLWRKHDVHGQRFGWQRRRIRPYTGLRRRRRRARNAWSPRSTDRNTATTRPLGKPRLAAQLSEARRSPSGSKWQVRSCGRSLRALLVMHRDALQAVAVVERSDRNRRPCRAEPAVPVCDSRWSPETLTSTRSRHSRKPGLPVHFALAGDDACARVEIADRLERLRAAVQRAGQQQAGNAKSRYGHRRHDDGRFCTGHGRLSRAACPTAIETRCRMLHASEERVSALTRLSVAA